MTPSAGAIAPNDRDPTEGGASNPPNAERYRHISTAQIIKLSDEQHLSQRKIGELLGMGPCAVGNRLRAAGKARRPPKLTPLQLEECRQDPAYEARPGIADRIVPADRVVCRECGELKSELNSNGMHGHLRKHHMTAEDYESKYAGARLTSFARSADQNRRQGRTKTVRDLTDEFAARYVMPKERAECRQDPDWEEHNGITDFVVCRLCGLKSKTDLFQHLKRHGCAPAVYRERFPKTQQMPLAMKHGYRRTYAKERGAVQRDQIAEAKRLKALRPTDWFEKPIEYRIIGDLLISREGHMGNRELAERLDASRILKCPYAATWKIALSRPGRATNFVSDVRKWMQRPGRTLTAK